MQTYVNSLKQMFGSGFQAQLMVNPYARSLVGLPEDAPPSSHNYHWIGGNSKKKQKTSKETKKNRNLKRAQERDR